MAVKLAMTASKNWITSLMITDHPDSFLDLKKNDGNDITVDSPREEVIIIAVGRTTSGWSI